MKKFLLLLTLVLTLTTVSFAAEITLTDIANTKYEEAVNALVKLEIISGYPNGEFRPLNKITRAELAKVLVTAKGVEVTDKVAAKNYFSDVTSEHWALAYVNAAYEEELVEGYEDKTFRPDEEVTYAEAITMVVRMLGYRTNVEMQNGTWPDNYIKKANSLKILKNVEYDNHNDDAIRGEVAVLVWNGLNVEKKYTTAGVLEQVNSSVLGGHVVTINGEKYDFPTTNNSVAIEDYKNGVIFYTLVQSQKKNDVTFLSGLKTSTISDDSTYTYYVKDKEGDEVLFTEGSNEFIEEFDEDFYDKYEDYIFVGLIYDKDEYEVIEVTLVTVSENVTAKDFKKFDRVYVDATNELVYIVTGLDEIK